MTNKIQLGIHPENSSFGPIYTKFHAFIKKCIIRPKICHISALLTADTYRKNFFCIVRSDFLFGSRLFIVYLSIGAPAVPWKLSQAY